MNRHDAACAVLGSWCEELGCQLEAGQKSWGEVLVPWAAPERPEARMDLVVHALGFPSPFYIDLTVVSALSSDALWWLSSSERSCGRDRRPREITGLSELCPHPLRH